MQSVLNFNEICLSHLHKVGGKNAALGEMLAQLSSLGIKVPRGFAIISDVYREFLNANYLPEKIDPLLADLDVKDIVKLQHVSAKIQKLMMKSDLPESFKEQVTQAYQHLKLPQGQAVAVRSSATAEDSSEASFAGQYDSYLNISGEQNVLSAVKRVYASLYTERTISYRAHHNFDHKDIVMSVGIQEMVRSDLGVSGVTFTRDIVSGDNNVIFISAVYGLGEGIVQGIVNPDEFYVNKTMLQEQGCIVSRKLGDKAMKMLYSDSDERVRTELINKEEQGRFCISDLEVLSLARQALLIEKYFGKPMDIEWAKDGVSGEIFVIQARPVTR